MVARFVSGSVRRRRSVRWGAALTAGLVAATALVLGAGPAQATPAVSSTITVGNRPNGVAVSPDGSTVYVANTGIGTPSTLSVIDTATNAVVATIPVGISPVGVGVSPDGSTVYVADQLSNAVSVIDTATNAVTATISSVGNYPSGVAVLPSGAKKGMVYVANLNGNTVAVIDPATDAVSTTISVGTSPYAVAASPNGSTVYVTNTNSKTVSVIDTATNTVTATIPVGNDPFRLAVSPDGSTVYVANQNDNTVSVIDTGTNAVTATIPVGSLPGGVAVSPDGSAAYVTSLGDSTVSVIDTATNTVTATIAVGSSPFGVAVSPAGETKGTAYTTNFGAGTVSVLAAPPLLGPPTGLAATAGAGQVGLSWTAPSDSGDPITDYLIEVSGDGGSTWTPFAHTPSAATTATVSGLANGTAYTFTVAAINSVGTGAVSAASSSVTPQAGQTITFTAPSTGTVGGTRTLNATASSGLAVALAVDASSTAGACTLAGATVRFAGVGSCVLDADQSGDAAYRAAARVQQAITIAAAPTPTPTPTPTPSPSPSPAPTSGAAMAVSNLSPNAQDRETFRVSGLRPGSTATFTLHSRPYLLGTAVVDRTGTASLTVTLPAGFVGAHEIVVRATDARGGALTLSRPITIKNTGTKTDTGTKTGSDTGAGPGGNGLAATGVSDLPALLGAALGLLLTGIAVLVLGGRRHEATDTH